MNKKIPKLTGKKKKMIEALEKSLGVVAPACRACQISRASHYKWMVEDELYKKEVDSLDDLSLDFAETQLHKQMREGVPSSTIFYLKTKGKKRGYVERQEITATVEHTQEELDLSHLSEEELDQYEKLLDKIGAVEE